MLHFLVSLLFSILLLSVTSLSITETFLIRFLQIMLVYMLGYFIKYIQPNQSIGIRISWTLSNEVVWKKTHLFTSHFWTSLSAVAMLLFPVIDPLDRNSFLIVFFILLFPPPILYSYWLSLNKKVDLDDGNSVK